MKRTLMVMLVALLAFALASGAFAAVKKPVSVKSGVSVKAKTTANVAKSKRVPKTAVKTVSAVCPVMGNKIPDVSKAGGKSVYKGKTYYFCCPGCKPTFDANPGKYIKKK